MTGRSHEIRADDLRHMLKAHGDAEVESRRTPAQIAITQADLQRIPEILSSYDAIEKGAATKKGKSVRYRKRINGEIYYVERLIRTRRERILLGKTMWKVPSAMGDAALKALPAHTSETTGGRAQDKYKIPPSERGCQAPRNHPRHGRHSRGAAGDRGNHPQDRPRRSLLQASPLPRHAEGEEPGRPFETRLLGKGSRPDHRRWERLFQGRRQDDAGPLRPGALGGDHQRGHRVEKTPCRSRGTPSMRLSRRSAPSC